MTCVLPNRRYFGSVADKVASEALAASHHVHSHQQAKETRSGLDATGSPRLSRRKKLSRSRVRPVRSERVWRHSWHKDICLLLVALSDVEMYGTLVYPSHLVDEDTIEKMKSKNII